MTDPVILAQLRARLLTTLTDTCAILRPAPITDASGHPSENFGIAQADVPCRLLPRARLYREGMVAGRDQGRAYYTLIVPHETDLRDGDRVLVNSVTYEVLQTDLARTDRADRQATLARFG